MLLKPNSETMRPRWFESEFDTCLRPLSEQPHGRRNGCYSRECRIEEPHPCLGVLQALDSPGRRRIYAGLALGSDVKRNTGLGGS